MQSAVISRSKRATEPSSSVKWQTRSVVTDFLSLCGIVALTVLATDALAQQPTRGASPVPSSAPPQACTVINSANASTYGNFLPSAADLAIRYGLVMGVVPTKRLDWSAGFTTDTEKYSGQVGLDTANYIANYVAGMPFPTGVVQSKRLDWSGGFTSETEKYSGQVGPCDPRSRECNYL
jgi:hypothetical protein